MPQGTALQSIALIPLEAFICKVKNNISIDESFILDQCPPSCGYYGIFQRGSSLYWYKQFFKDDTSALFTYNVTDKHLQQVRIQETYDRIFL
ncbi:hypothetical protein C2I18_22000 [Paenibacillus sp. PK3_47]|nr:hypothetical protein C2I18_22000 [Paenibacillus sp. PK3_47]